MLHMLHDTHVALLSCAAAVEVPPGTAHVKLNVCVYDGTFGDAIGTLRLQSCIWGNMAKTPAGLAACLCLKLQGLT